MNPVGLRLHLTPDVLSKLVTAVADKFKRFVRISRTEHAGGLYEVDLRILASYDVVEPKVEGTHPTESVVVTREMLGELFDLLGIFPRSNKLTDDVRILIQNIRTATSGIYSVADMVPDRMVVSEIGSKGRLINLNLERLENLIVNRQ